jgi:NhaP-type Na+/H+ or K+/H+ antiporter
MNPSSKQLLQGLLFTLIGAMLLLDRFGIPLWKHIITLMYVAIMLYGLVLINRALK